MDGFWWILIPGFFIWMAMSKGGACSSRRSRRTSEARRTDSDEVAHLKAQLASRDGQIDLLTRRLEALETIVTDEERRLRREFDALQHG
ncbi:MAG: hypothetical protein AAFR33_01910 [Pseudomonadota bacterium]